MSIQFINSTKILRAIKECPEKMSAALADQLEQAGNRIRDEAKRLAPVDTGALRDSIKTRVNRRGLKTTVKIFADYPRGKGVRKTKTRKQVKGARVYYAFAVEYGTTHRKATPFLMPAARKEREGLEKKITSAMDLVLEKEFKK